MTPIHFPGVNHELGQPDNWDETALGPCGSLPVQLDTSSQVLPIWTVKYMPSEEEMNKLIAGEPISVAILGFSFPPIEVKVGD